MSLQLELLWWPTCEQKRTLFRPPPLSHILFSLKGFKATFLLKGPKESLKIPQKNSPSARENGLWKTTCFEIFWKTSLQNPEYFELNLSPSGAWNCFHFLSYRSPNPPQEYSQIKTLEPFYSVEDGQMFLTLPPEQICALHATSVIETKDGSLFYFSSKIMDQNPDFHLEDLFQPIDPSSRSIL